MSGHQIGAVPANELPEILKNENNVLIDVRTSYEFNQGHVEEAIHIPLDQLNADSLVDKGIDKDKNVYIICRSGNRSLHAAYFLSEHGHKTINVTGGMTFWQIHGLPVAS